MGLYRIKYYEDKEVRKKKTGMTDISKMTLFLQEINGGIDKQWQKRDSVKLATLPSSKVSPKRLLVKEPQSNNSYRSSLWTYRPSFPQRFHT